jgi:hypothetical protein
LRNTFSISVDVIREPFGERRRSGATRSVEPQMCNCTSGNLVIPGSCVTRPGMTTSHRRQSLL